MRKSGILLHPTSLPGRWGIGDLGEWAYRFVDFLAESGQQLWQILPLGPPGCGWSPYQAYSSVAGNPLLISLETLLERSWLEAGDLEPAPAFPADRVDFEAVAPLKSALIRKAAAGFFRNPSDPLREPFRRFCDEQKSWLEPFAQFAARKQADPSSWLDWDPAAAPAAREVLDQKFVQFEFFRQWESLKKHANDRGVQILGDLPIFVAHDSADVWANPGLFDLDDGGRARNVAGVPPDYFSATGQYWGNPLYRWEAMAAANYSWWVERIRSTLRTVDIVRLDHFRGFEKYWEIPAGSETAASGRWVEGPGDRFFQALKGQLGSMPFIAEDLGLITPEVHRLRDRWGLPGMRVLQFGFGDESPANPHKPYNFIRNCVAYTGTHDNDTTAGWLAARSEARRAIEYLGGGADGALWACIRLVLASVADTAVVPMQDVLGLGTQSRMNVPATVDNNWRWRMREDALRPELAQKLRRLNRIYGRLP